MTNEKLKGEHIQAALRMEEKRLRDLMAAMEMDDVPPAAVVHQIRFIEDGLKRIRRAA